MALSRAKLRILIVAAIVITGGMFAVRSMLRPHADPRFVGTWSYVSNAGTIVFNNDGTCTWTGGVPSNWWVRGNRLWIIPKSRTLLGQLAKTVRAVTGIQRDDDSTEILDTTADTIRLRTSNGMTVSWKRMNESERKAGTQPDSQTPSRQTTTLLKADR